MFFFVQPPWPSKSRISGRLLVWLWFIREFSPRILGEMILQKNVLVERAFLQTVFWKKIRWHQPPKRLYNIGGPKNGVESWGIGGYINQPPLKQEVYQVVQCPTWQVPKQKKPDNNNKLSTVGIGFERFFKNVHPDFWGDDPILTSIFFQMGWNSTTN